MSESQTQGNPKIRRSSGAVESDFDRRFRQLLSLVMSESVLDRQQVADQLTARLQRRITVSIMNDYTTTTRTTARFPAAYVPALCEVVQDDRLRQFLLDPECQSLIELGKHVADAERQRRGLVKAVLEARARKERRA